MIIVPMKNLFSSILVVAGLLALAGCADDSHSQTTASTNSVTMSGDSKTMTGSTVTQEAPPPAETTTTTDSSAIGYPAIHTSGQH